VNGLHLPSPETLLALNLEDGWYRYARPFNNLMVGIEEWASQALRQLATDSCFAGPH
jgi:hypothetical protein